MTHGGQWALPEPDTRDGGTRAHAGHTMGGGGLVCEQRRGPPLCRRVRAGCVRYRHPTTDEGVACRYEWDCQGTCTAKGCSGTVPERGPGSEYGCQTRCMDGVVRVGVCVD